MYDVKSLFRPASLEEALEILRNDPAVRPLAGGTDVLVSLRKNGTKGVCLMSLDRITVLKGIGKREDGAIEIGPMTTFAEIGRDGLIGSELPALKTAALSMGGPQIQNVATIGGNICNGAVSADSAPSLFALDAGLVLKTADSERVIPIAGFYLGPGKVDRKPGELLVKIVIPAREARSGCAYIKFATRKAMDLAILGVAAACALNDDGTIKTAAVALGVAAPVPVRCPQAERYLSGKRPDETVLKEAGELALRDASPRDSWRASKRYREGLIKELTGRALKAAYDQAAAHSR